MKIPIKRTILIIILITIVLCSFWSGLKAVTWYQQVVERKKAIAVREELALQNVSERTGQQFKDWISVREYLYCQLLQKGMERKKVENALSTIGEIQPFHNLWKTETIIYDDDTLDKYLTPIILEFSKEGLEGELLNWTRSYEHIVPIPLASCEVSIIEK